MNTAKEYVHKLIDEMSEIELPEVIDFIDYLRAKKSKDDYTDLQEGSQSSMSFWDNDIDEVWNEL